MSSAPIAVASSKSVILSSLEETCGDGPGVRPLAFDLFCGLGGWAEGFLAEGWRVIGVDIERHDYGTGGYPGQLVLQNILTLHGAQLALAAVIVASPPCQKYSYMAMPWARAKREIRWQQWERDSRFGDFRLNDLFRACFRIQREAIAAAGRYIPMVVENVKGAQPWVGRAAWHYGSYYLWGDVPALMPFAGGSRKVPMNFHEFEKTGQPGRSFQSAAVEHTKNNGGSWFNVAHNTESGVGQNPVNGDGQKLRPGHDTFKADGASCGKLTDPRYGVKQHGSGAAWFDKALDKRRKSVGTKQGGSWFHDSNGTLRAHNSKSNSRKAASAQIAKIPFELARHIARVYKPHVDAVE